MGIESPVHLLFIAVVALLVLGPKRLPGLARALGQGIREFRGALEEAAASPAEPTDKPAETAVALRPTEATEKPAETPVGPGQATARPAAQPGQAAAQPRRVPSPSEPPPPTPPSG
jgi:TatA/E family protein of Tat protein translocase